VNQTGDGDAQRAGNNDRSRRRWTVTALYVLMVYATIFVARPLGSFLRDQALLYPVMYAVFTAAFLWTLGFLAGAGFRRSARTLLLLAAAGGGAVYALATFRRVEEVVHFLEYAIMAILIFRAFSASRDPGKAFLFSLALVIALGWLDEAIQYVTPGRYYDIRDVFFNGLGGGAGLVFLYVYRLDMGRQER